MLNSIGKFFYSPSFADDEKTRRAEILHYGSIILFVFTTFLFWINSAFGTQAAKDANWLLGLIALVQIAVQRLIRSGYVSAASFILLTIAWAVMTGINLNVGGIYDEAIFGYVLIILASGYLLGWRIATAYTLLSIAALWLLASLEMNGSLVPVVDNPYWTAFDLTVVFILIFFVVFFLIKTLTKALENSQQELSERIRLELEREELINQLSKEIAQRKRAQNKLRRLANTDPLTGVNNRRYFMRRASDELERIKRYYYPISLMLLDIDQFKVINDTYGHKAGDEVLKSFAKHCLSHLRPFDQFARLGGDEFIALLVQVDQDNAKKIADRLRASFERLKIQIDKKTITATVSIGMATTTDNILSVKDLIKRADEALYKAKNEGRNQIAIMSIGIESPNIACN
jgi:diguanylate cyclase (GGDEF)-like protein